MPATSALPVTLVCQAISASPNRFLRLPRSDAAEPPAIASHPCRHAYSHSIILLLQGLMTWGEEGTSGARVTDLKDCEKMLNIFLKHGHNEVDTAYMYTNQTSEQYLGKIDYKKLGVVVDTKLYPNKAAGITHSAADLRKYINIQLKALNSTCIDMWYLHAPDRSTPFEETFKAVDELYKEGLFKRFGISNYQSWEVAHIVGLCEKNGWIKPTAYQGLYNAVHRNVEAELFPCLRALGLSFYEFNPLGGGFFTGQYSKDAPVEAGSRFDDAKQQGQNYRSRYWKVCTFSRLSHRNWAELSLPFPQDEYFQALEIVKPVAEAHSLTLAEVALRWVSHHSLMKREFGDNVLIGASSNAHLEQNLIDLEKGPLPEDVVKVLDQAWEHVRPVATKYWH
ncbi:aflatoxin B1 aldehyde reductase, partial [Phenoliferia sp. Uapishka_3]